MCSRLQLEWCRQLTQLSVDCKFNWSSIPTNWFDWSGMDKLLGAGNWCSTLRATYCIQLKLVQMGNAHRAYNNRCLRFDSLVNWPRGGHTGAIFQLQGQERGTPFRSAPIYQGSFEKYHIPPVWLAREWYYTNDPWYFGHHQKVSSSPARAVEI